MRFRCDTQRAMRCAPEFIDLIEVTCVPDGDKQRAMRRTLLCSIYVNSFCAVLIVHGFHLQWADVFAADHALYCWNEANSVGIILDALTSPIVGHYVDHFDTLLYMIGVEACR